jgi:hypothetical protein
MFGPQSSRDRYTTALRRNATARNAQARHAERRRTMLTTTAVASAIWQAATPAVRIRSWLPGVTRTPRIPGENPWSHPLHRYSQRTLIAGTCQWPV